MRGVSAGRVTQWITEGKIGPDALVGEGRGAKINAALALEQLRERLDPSQRFSTNGLSTRLADEDDPPPPPQPPPPPAPREKVAALPKTPRRVVDEIEPEQRPVRITREGETVEAGLKRHKLRQAVLQTERLEEEANLRKGLYVETAMARGAASQLSAAWLAHFDSALRDFASATAAKFGIPGREVQHLLQTEWLRLRAEIAAKHAANAKKEPPTREVDLDSPDDIQ
jgi:hypothetical protein